MGVYTWVPKYCCGEELQFQSKSDPNMEYGSYDDLNNIPIEVARDINGESQTCPYCLTEYTIRIKDRDLSTVPMEITSRDASDD